MQISLQSRSGFFLIASLSVMLILTVLTSVTMTRSVQELRAAEQMTMTSNGFELAEAGLDASAQYFAWPHSQGQLTPLSGGTYQYTVVPLGNALYQVTGVGQFPAGATTTHQISTIIQALPTTPFQYAVYGKNSIAMDDNQPAWTNIRGKTDSYDSRLGAYQADLGHHTFNQGQQGDVATMGDIVLDGVSAPPVGITINGQVIIPHQEDLDAQGSVTITGGVHEDTPIAMPSFPMPSSTCEDLDLNATFKPLEGAQAGEQPRVYCYHNLTLTHGAVLEPSGPVVIIVTGQLRVEDQLTRLGNADPKHHPDLMVAVPAANDADNQDSSVNILEPNMNDARKLMVYGAIYAPNVPVRLQGDVQVFGAVIGSDVKMEFQTMVHYNVAFRNYALELGTQHRAQLLWKES